MTGVRVNHCLTSTILSAARSFFQDLQANSHYSLLRTRFFLAISCSRSARIIRNSVKGLSRSVPRLSPMLRLTKFRATRLLLRLFSGNQSTSVVGTNGHTISKSHCLQNAIFGKQLSVMGSQRANSPSFCFFHSEHCFIRFLSFCLSRSKNSFTSRGKTRKILFLLRNSLWPFNVFNDLCRLHRRLFKQGKTKEQGSRFRSDHVLPFRCVVLQATAQSSVTMSHARKILQSNIRRVLRIASDQDNALRQDPFQRLSGNERHLTPNSQRGLHASGKGRRPHCRRRRRDTTSRRPATTRRHTRRKTMANGPSTISPPYAAADAAVLPSNGPIVRRQSRRSHRGRQQCRQRHRHPNLVFGRFSEDTV